MKLVAGLGVIACAVLPAIAASAAQGIFSASGSMAPGSTLSVRNINGDIAVTTGRSLAIRAVKTAHHGDPGQVRIVAHATARGYVVCAVYPGDPASNCDDAAGGVHIDHDSNRTNDNDTKVDFTITVPSGAGVNAQTVNGNIALRTDAHASATDVNGTVDIDAADVDHAATVNGTVDVRVSDRSASEPIELVSVNGSVICRLPSISHLTVDAAVLNGDIDAAGLTVQRPFYGVGASAKGTIGGGGRRLKLDTVNGSIKILRA